MPDVIPRPLPVKALSRYFKPRGALEKKPIEIEHRFHIAADRRPKIKTRLQRVNRRDGKSHWEVIVDIAGVRAGGRALPPALKGKATRVAKRKLPEAELAKRLTGYIPRHLGFSAVPRARVKTFRHIRPVAGDRRVATTIFGTDNRMAFQDTTYPWSTVGLVQTNRGSGFGVMIGPRHLLTVSHVIDWTAPAGFAADWVRFTPSFSMGTPRSARPMASISTGISKRMATDLSQATKATSTMSWLFSTGGWVRRLAGWGRAATTTPGTTWMSGLTWAIHLISTAARDRLGRVGFVSTVRTPLRNQSCTKPMSSRASRAGQSSVSGPVMSDRVPWRFSRGKTPPTMAPAGAWTCGTWLSSPGRTLPDADQRNVVEIRGPKQVSRLLTSA
jgi:hypothetical protein